MDLINYLLPKIEHFHILGYWILLLIAFLESLAFVGMLVPGTFFIVLFGSLAANGYFSIGDLIWFAVIGAFLGDVTSFHLGKKGTGFFSVSNRIFRTGYLEQGKVFFRKHGTKSVFLGRFVGPVRAVIPFIAGLSAMDPAKFYFWDILSAVAWAVSHLLLGYFLGHAWRLVEVWSTRIGVFLAAVAIFVVCGYLLKRFLVNKGKRLFAFLASVVVSVGQSISARPGVRKFVRNHPRVVAYLWNRVHTQEFSGLPLTLLGMAFFYILLLLLGVIEDVVTSDTIVEVDTHIESLLFLYRNPLLVKAFLWATVLGKLKIIIVMAVAATLLFRIWNRRSFIAPLWITIIGSHLFILLGKIALHRPRPVGLGVYSESFYSFPSGHATIAMAFFGYIAYFLWRETAAWKNRLNILFAAGIVILSVGFSRLYLGVHYLSDVLGGYLLGLLWLITGICIRELRPAQPAVQPASAPPTFKIRIVTAVILFAASGFYLYSAYNFHPARIFPEEKRKIVVNGSDVVQIFTVYRLPRYTESISGEKQEPLSLLMVAEKDETITEALRKAGWQQADTVRIFAVAKTLNAFLFNENYPAAPITPSFWDERVNDMNFVKSTPPYTVRRRHEARFWKTDFITDDGRNIYVGTATFSEGSRRWIIPGKGPHPDVEREALLMDMVRAEATASYGRYELVPSLSGRTFTGDPFRTDGGMYIIHLK